MNITSTFFSYFECEMRGWTVARERHTIKNKVKNMENLS